MLALILASTVAIPQQTPWTALFDGKSTKGWRAYRGTKIGDGWKVENGQLILTDARTGGDIITEAQYESFELRLEFNLDKGQNGGVMFHVTEEADAPWQTGPEVQLYDHPVQAGVQTTGYLYELYAAPDLRPRPAGEWNELRLVVTKQKSFVELNGVRGYEFVLGSEDFLSRVAKSKFRAYPKFGKTGKGHIALQGDHGTMRFRNIGIRTL